MSHTIYKQSEAGFISKCIRSTLANMANPEVFVNDLNKTKDLSDEQKKFLKENADCYKSASEIFHAMFPSSDRDSSSTPLFRRRGFQEIQRYFKGVEFQKKLLEKGLLSFEGPDGNKKIETTQKGYDLMKLIANREEEFEMDVKAKIRDNAVNILMGLVEHSFQDNGADGIGY